MAATEDRSSPEALRDSVAAISTPEARSDSPALRASGLPGYYRPYQAGYAPGRFLVPEVVTPSPMVWKGASTYLVEDSRDGLTYRALRVTRRDGSLVGFWAIERVIRNYTLPEQEN
jgi:hypothetical protein